MIPFWLYQSAFGLQLVALALFFAYAAFPRRELSLAASSTLAVAGSLQLLFTLLLAWRDGAVPLGNAFEALNFCALIFTLLTLYLEWRWKMGLLGAFLSPFASLFLLMGIRFGSALPPGTAPYGGLFLLLHVGLPMAGYALFTASAGLSLAYLMEERQLKRGHLSGAAYTLPPVTELERLARAHMIGGLACLGLGIAAAFAKDPGNFLSRMETDSKAAFACALFALYAAILGSRRLGLRGRRFALLSLAGFTAIFFGFYLVNIYYGGHGDLK